MRTFGRPLHRTEQLKIIAIRVCKRCDPTSRYLIRFLDHLSAHGLDPFKLFFHLRGFKIKHYTPGVFGLPVHFGMVEDQ